MSMIPSFSGRRSNSVFNDPFAIEVWDPFEGWPFDSNSRRHSDGLRPQFFPSSDTGPFPGRDGGLERNPSTYMFKMDVPGLRKDAVEDDRYLQISGEQRREAEKKGDTWHRVESSSWRFVRRFRLPENLKVEGVRASMEKRVLIVTVPKADEKKPDVKCIDISG